MRKAGEMCEVGDGDRTWTLGALIRDDEGIAMAMVVAIAAILFVLLSALITVAVGQNSESSAHSKKAQVLDVADAGIAAYMYMLKNGNQGWYAYESVPMMTGTSGNGSWTVAVTPPPTGSSSIMLTSVGTIASLGVRRTVVAYVRPPSFADYTFLTNGALNFGGSARINGKVHSNVSIDLQSGGIIYGTASVPTTAGIAKITGSGSYRGVPPKKTQPYISFTTITGDLATIKSVSTTHSAYFAALGNQPNGKPYFGYNLVFNGANYTASRVCSENPTSGKLGLETSTTITRSLPASEAMYFEDPIWVTGTYSGTVVIGDGNSNISGNNDTATAQGAPNSAVYLPDDLTPTDPSDVNQMIGIVTKGDISFPCWWNFAGAPSVSTPSSYTVQAAMISQNGHFHADWWDISPTRHVDQINILGSLVTQGSDNMVSGDGTSGMFGFGARNYRYDTRFAMRVPTLYPRPVVYGGDSLTISSWQDSP